MASLWHGRGSALGRNRRASVYDGRATLVPSQKRLWEHILVWTRRNAIHCRDKLFVLAKPELRWFWLLVFFFFPAMLLHLRCSIGSLIVKTVSNSMIYNRIDRYSIIWLCSLGEAFRAFGIRTQRVLELQLSQILHCFLTVHCSHCCNAIALVLAYAWGPQTLGVFP